MGTVNYHSLVSIGQVRLKPLKQFTTDTIGMQFGQEYLVVDLIKGLGKVQVYTISIMAIQEVIQDSIYMFQQLGQASSSLAEAMLVGAQKIVKFYLLYNMCSENPLEDFDDMRCQGYWTVVRWFGA